MTDPVAPPPEPNRAGQQVEIPEARVVSRQWRTFPLFWLVPIVAVLIGLTLLVRGLSEEGPSIEIHFKNAEGLEAGKTKIKYKNVDIGEVKTIRLASDHDSVTVIAQMQHEAGQLLVEDTRFWVVRPRVAGGQISGLATLVSGSYIGMDIGKSNESRRSFVGLETAPTVTTDEPGRVFLLKSNDLGSLDVGSPVYFRKVQVGQVTSVDLDPDGGGVSLRIFVRSPFEHLVTRNSRFWHASGLDITLDANGVSVHTQSLVSILLGGIAFAPPPEGGAGSVAPQDTTFVLAENETLAMRRTDAEITPLLAYFTESVRGLSVGAPVDFRGVTIGEVKSIDVQFEAEQARARFAVVLSLYVDRLSAEPRPSGKRAVEHAELLEQAIAHGLKAQLRTANLLTGQRFVALDFFPSVATSAAKFVAIPGEIPTVPGGLEDLQLALTELAKKVDKVPFEAIAKDLRQTMASLQRTLNDTDLLMQQLHGQVAPQLTDLLGEAKRAMGSANELLSRDAPAQQDLREALRELSRSAESLRELTDMLQRHPEVLLRGRAGNPEETIR
ncbi:MAG: MlaD family protein [Burkholderiaceae bacterium]|jgi:paraquat-inducible protein B